MPKPTLSSIAETTWNTAARKHKRLVGLVGLVGLVERDEAATENSVKNHQGDKELSRRLI